MAIPDIDKLYQSMVRAQLEVSTIDDDDNEMRKIQYRIPGMQAKKELNRSLFIANEIFIKWDNKREMFSRFSIERKALRRWTIVLDALKKRENSISQRHKRNTERYQSNKRVLDAVTIALSRTPETATVTVTEKSRTNKEVERQQRDDALAQALDAIEQGEAINAQRLREQELDDPFAPYKEQENK